jgi:drug/metabolite transporter (DMT)-like permease
LIVLSQSAVWIRLAAASADALGFWRMAIALPVLAVLVTRHRAWSEVRALRLRQWLALFLCGFFLYAHFFTWFLSVQKTTMANSMIVFSINPLFTAVGAWIFFRERLQRRHGIALGLCFLGIYFMMRDSIQINPSHFAGDLLGIACAILFSAYVLTSKGIRQNLNNLPFAFITYNFVGIFFALTMLFFGTPFFAYSARTWTAFCGLAFGSTILGHSMFTYCLQFFNVNLMSISTLTEPMLTALSGYVFFSEPLSRGAVIGFLFVAAGIVALYWPFHLSWRYRR